MNGILEILYIKIVLREENVSFAFNERLNKTYWLNMLVNFKIPKLQNRTLKIYICKIFSFKIYLLI